jgi:hypothetical protein
MNQDQCCDPHASYGAALNVPLMHRNVTKLINFLLLDKHLFKNIH